MSLETTSTAPATESAAPVSTPVVESQAVETTNSGSGYSVVDPGYDGDDGDDFESNNPPETSGDASGDEQTTEETVVTPTVETVDSAEISDELLDRAFDLGYTVEDLKAFDNVTSLEKEINRTAKLRDRWQKHQAGKLPQPEPEPLLAVDPDELEEPKWDELIEQGHDPDIIAVQKRNWQRMTRAEAVANQVIRSERDRAYQAQCDRFDEVLNNIGEEFQPVFGQGKRGELVETSPEQVANRQKVFTKMNMLRHGYLQAGEKVPPEAELIQEAVHASFYKHSQQTARKKLIGDIKKSSSQSLSRPNSGGARPISGPALALQKEQEFWRERST